MGRRHRYDAPDQTHHVTARVNWRAWHLAEDDAKASAARLLKNSAEAFGMAILGGVLMSNHLHLVVQSPPPELYRQLTGRRTPCRHLRAWPKHHQKSTVIAQFMRAFRHPISADRQKELELSGRFWEGEYDARPVLDELSLVVRIAYDHRNPVKAALVARAEDYRWRSASAWATGVVGAFPVTLDRTPPFGSERVSLRAEVLRYQCDSRLDEVGDDLARIFGGRSPEADSSALVELLAANRLLPRCVSGAAKR